MDSSRFKLAARSLALIFGCFLLAPILVLEVFLSRTAGPVLPTALLVFGFPCGALLYFARTGRRDWRAGLVVPILVIFQVVAVLASLHMWPHSRVSHVALCVAVSWAVLLAGHYLIRRRPQSRAAEHL